MDATNRQELADKIEAAFRQAPYPGDDHIGIGFDGEEVEADFKGKHWRDLPLDLIIWHRDKMPSLTPEAFRFYLPAYFLAALWHFDEVDTLRDNLVFNLAVFTPENQPATRLLRNAKIMTADEKLVIVEFLRNYEAIFTERFYSDSLTEDVQRGIQFWTTAS